MTVARAIGLGFGMRRYHAGGWVVFMGKAALAHRPTCALAFRALTRLAEMMA